MEGRTKVDSPSRSLVVLNRSAPEPIQSMLEEAFVGQPVEVSERELPDEDEDLVVLVEESGHDAEVIATSPPEALQETILLVNSDLYRDVRKSSQDRPQYGVRSTW
jgi:hypothetical protein